MRPINIYHLSKFVARSLDHLLVSILAATASRYGRRGMRVPVTYRRGLRRQKEVGESWHRPLRQAQQGVELDRGGHWLATRRTWGACIPSRVQKTLWSRGGWRSRTRGAGREARARASLRANQRANQCWATLQAKVATPMKKGMSCVANLRARGGSASNCRASLAAPGPR